MVKSTVPAGTMEVRAHIQITTDWEKEAALPHLNTPLLHYRHRNIPGGKTLQIGMNEVTICGKMYLFRKMDG